MTGLPPINRHASVPAVYDERSFDAASAAAGHWHFFVTEPHGDPAGILFGCPCGCGQMRAIEFRGGRRAGWLWNGNREKPSLLPSIRFDTTDSRGKRTGIHWHGFLKAGRFESF